MEDKARRSLVIAGLKPRLEPLGFVLEEGPEESFWFTRPLRPGGGYQIVRAVIGFRLQLNVTSARYLRIQQQRGWWLENPTLNGDNPMGVVVSQDMDRVSTYPFDTIAYDEDAAWYFEEFERLFLPALEHLHTARDLYEWYWDERWKPYNSDQGGLYSLYAARYLPDAGFLPIVDQFLVKVPKGPMNEFAQFLRTQPMFSDELL